MKRILYSTLLEDLEKKTVLLAGPRQVGKTYLAKQICRKLRGAYFNWDIDGDRRIVRNQELPANGTLWVLDEIHKFRSWRNFLKGLIDAHHPKQKILVTGSARLAHYRHGGDSLQGRYFFHRLHPFTLTELLGRPRLEEIPSFEELSEETKAGREALSDLLAKGGFPEPLLKLNARDAKRWRTGYGDRLVREDLRDLTRIESLDKTEMLFDRLPDLVGAPLSIRQVALDLEVAFNSVKSWLMALENLYAFFRISPFGSPRIKAVKKEQKLYPWDWARVNDPGPKLEALVACHLKAFSDSLLDRFGEKTELRYFRSTVGHEVDFILMRNRKPWVAVEVKTKAETPNKGLKYLLPRVDIPRAFQIHLQGEKDYEHVLKNGQKIRVCSVARFLQKLA